MTLGLLIRTTVASALLAANAVMAAPPKALSGPSAWTNELGSTLYIDTIDPNSGQLSGRYVNRAAGYGCQNISYPVTGWVYGTALTFTTRWESATESCNSITAWTGFYYQGQISALWQLVVNGSSSTSQILQGADTFSPTESTVRKSLILEK